MTDLHRNVFSYFLGASQPDRDRQRQLEDNTTKALVNTLEHCGRDIAVKFLQWLGISAAGSIRFAQQKSSIGDDRIRGKSQKLLLAIVGTRFEDEDTVFKLLKNRPTGDSRPDAWLYGDDFVVLIESKVGDSNLDLNQLACHWHKLRPNRCVIRTWSEVHRFFVGLANGMADTKSKWMVEQFTEYLELTGMTEFVGFKEEMFEFFVAAERDPEAQKWVRGAVDGLAEKVLNGKDGLKTFDEWYSHKTVGNFAKGADHYWVAFGPEKEFRNWAHQTLALFEQKLDIFVNVELLPAIKRLRKKIENGEFRKVLCSLPAPFTVHIEERRTTKQPRVFDYFPLAEVKTGIYKRKRYGLTDLSSPGFEYIEKLLCDIEYPYLSVRRRIDRGRVLDLSKPNGDALVKEVLDTLKVFHPLVKLINE